MPTDQFDQFKAMQKESWAHFAPVEIFTTMPAAQLVKHAGVRAGQRMLDCACGTGVLGVTAARQGAKVTGLDLTPELLERARYNSQISKVEIDWHEGDVENLPFEDATFDVVGSQFGYIVFCAAPSRSNRRNAALSGAVAQSPSLHGRLNSVSAACSR